MYSVGNVAKFFSAVKWISILQIFINVNVSFQSLDVLDWDSSWFCSPVALWTPVSSCMELLTDAQAGIDKVQMALCCSDIPHPLVSPPDVFKLLIRTDSMT